MWPSLNAMGYRCHCLSLGGGHGVCLRFRGREACGAPSLRCDEALERQYNHGYFCSQIWKIQRATDHYKEKRNKYPLMTAENGCESPRVPHRVLRDYLRNYGLLEADCTVGLKGLLVCIWGDGNPAVDTHIPTCGGCRASVLWPLWPSYLSSLLRSHSAHGVNRPYGIKWPSSFHR